MNENIGKMDSPSAFEWKTFSLQLKLAVVVFDGLDELLAEDVDGKELLLVGLVVEGCLVQIKLK